MTMSDTPNKRWLSPYERDDGLLIVRNDDQSGYHVIHANKIGILRVCPCCDKPFSTPRAAQLVADLVFPIPDAPKLRGPD